MDSCFEQTKSKISRGVVLGWFTPPELGSCMIHHEASNNRLAVNSIWQGALYSTQVPLLGRSRVRIYASASLFLGFSASWLALGRLELMLCM